MDALGFWAKVRKGGEDECWPWTGAIVRGGYGSVWIDGEWMSAHRAAYRLVKGPLGRWRVRHTCDNRPCCNPAHLVRGTQKQNIADAMKRGRMSKPPRHQGATHPRAVLSEENVRDIRAATGTPTQIGRSLGVSVRAVEGVLNGKAWGWLS